MIIKPAQLFPIMRDQTENGLFVVNAKKSTLLILFTHYYIVAKS